MMQWEMRPWEGEAVGQYGSTCSGLWDSETGDKVGFGQWEMRRLRNWAQSTSHPQRREYYSIRKTVHNNTSGHNWTVNCKVYSCRGGFLIHIHQSRSEIKNLTAPIIQRFDWILNSTFSSGVGGDRGGCSMFVLIIRLIIIILPRVSCCCILTGRRRGGQIS